MTENITNADRMTLFLDQLISDQPNPDLIKLYGRAAEIYEDSLITYVNKMLRYLY